jgi:3'(2'), 5'-bisphosphate nucleotidase
MPYERELAEALAVVEAARRPILEEYSRFQPLPDAAADIKLAVDRQTQELLLQRLAAAFPQDSFCAEEDTPALARTQREARSRQRTWVIDPIDGTRGFAQKNGEFSVMVGLIDGSDVVLGVVFEPVRERLTYATRGGGCWQRDGGSAAVRCRVTTVDQLEGSALVRSRSSGSGRKSKVVEALGDVRLVQMYSAGIKLAVVARGEVDLYVNSYPNFHDWDICAGQILVEEAGGRVTGLKGQPIVYGRGDAGQRDGMLASNGALHEAALAALATVS